ncbi:MAG: hypothetical protein BGP21_08660 [Thiobacillus sp. 65-29]|nr:MAG: hypothetical protein BGP21_08660 [Thiobacillus sp. 65-29]
MKMEVLNIAPGVNPQEAEQAGTALKAMAGVQDVLYLDFPARLQAQIDASLVSRDDLVAALAQAGIPVTDAPAPTGGSSCCGGCCSG